MRYRLFVLLVSMWGCLFSCADPGGLDSVSGVTGQVYFNTTWPDTLKGAVVLVFSDSMDATRVNEPGYNVADYYITYGNPIDPDTPSAEYFVQLGPGQYILMVIGLLAEPSQLLTNEELFQQIQNYIVVPENAAPRGIVIREKKINEQTDWYVQF